MTLSLCAICTVIWVMMSKILGFRSVRRSFSSCSDFRRGFPLSEWTNVWVDDLTLAFLPQHRQHLVEHPKLFSGHTMSDLIVMSLLQVLLSRRKPTRSLVQTSFDYYFLLIISLYVSLILTKSWAYVRSGVAIFMSPPA